MSFLLDLFPGKIWIYLVVLAGAAAAGGGVAWTVQGYRLGAARAQTDKVQAEFNGFVETTKSLGEAAQAAATEKTRLDIAAKRRIDDASKTELDNFHATIKQLRDSRAAGSGSGFVPSAASSPASPDRACFSRPELESAVGELDRAVQSLVDQGSEAVINLDSAKRWAQEK